MKQTAAATLNIVRQDGTKEAPVSVVLKLTDNATLDPVSLKAKNIGVNGQWSNGEDNFGLYLYNSDDGKVLLSDLLCRWDSYTGSTTKVPNRFISKEYYGKIDAFKLRADNSVFERYSETVSCKAKDLIVRPTEIGKQLRKTFNQASIFSANGFVTNDAQALLEILEIPITQTISFVVKPVNVQKEKLFTINHIMLDLFINKRDFGSGFTEEELNSKVVPRCYGALDTPIEYTSSDYIYVTLELRTLVTIDMQPYSTTFTHSKGESLFHFFKYFTKDIVHASKLKEAYPDVDFGTKYVNDPVPNIDIDVSNYTDDKFTTLNRPLRYLYSPNAYAPMYGSMNPKHINLVNYVSKVSENEFTGFDQWGYIGMANAINQLKTKGFSNTLEDMFKGFHGVYCRNESGTQNYSQNPSPNNASPNGVATYLVNETQMNIGEIFSLAISQNHGIDYNSTGFNNVRTLGFSMEPLWKDNKGTLTFSLTNPPATDGLTNWED